jgi:hypothetical protein
MAVTVPDVPENVKGARGARERAVSTCA